MPNTQEENENEILTSERLNNLDTLVDILKGSTINNAGYIMNQTQRTKMTQKAILQAIQR